MSEGESSVENLVHEGQAALESGDYGRAMDLARQLRRAGHRASYEIEARVFWDTDEPERAIQVLQEGVEQFPESFVLWDYLGSFLSDENRFEESIQAYYQARECPEAPTEAVDFNIAVVYQREDRHERALALLETIGPSDMLPQAMVDGARAYSLNEVGKHGDALTLTAGSLSGIGEDEEVDPEAVARLLSEHAYALWLMGIHEAAYMEAAESVALDKLNRRAAWLLREIADEKAPNAKSWQVVVEGIWSEAFEDADEPYGFLAEYIVVAESPEEALEYISIFEPEEVRESLKVRSATEGDDQPDTPKGVYEAGAVYRFFPLK
jgi:tetratricopeptide (TPR) repeat protein